MKAPHSRVRWILALLLVSTAIYGNPNAEFEKGRSAYLKSDYPKAEEHFRACIGMDSERWLAHLYLGHSLFFQEKYAEAIPAYETAMQLGAASMELKEAEQRLLTDQLGMSYGISGHLEKAKALFEAAIQEDPDYAMYYYNLACTHAESGELDDALSNLRLGFERRANMRPGERYPNPRNDASFRSFLRDQKFETALKEMGF